MSDDFAELFVLPTVHAMFFSKNNVVIFTKEQIEVLDGYHKQIKAYLNSKIA